MSKHNGFRKMTMQIFMRYKQEHNTIPRCVSCGSLISVDSKFLSFYGRIIKYACEECSKKYEKTGILVFQYPHSRVPFQKTENWIHETEKYTSM